MLATPQTIRDCTTGMRKARADQAAKARVPRVRGIMTSGTGLNGVCRAKEVGVRLDTQA